MMIMKEKNLVHLLFFMFTLVKLTYCAKDTDALYYVANSKGLDYKFAGKQDAHRFGVELKENKQFHHTVTAEDGVRLGCYGFTLGGTKYSTNYIADGKGYRLAPSQDLITVYGKGSSEPRIASFAESFTEEEIRKANIRYFFPDGCEAPKLIFDPTMPSPAYENRKKLFDSLVEKARLENLKNLNSQSNNRNINGSSNLNGGNNSLNNKNTLKGSEIPSINSKSSHDSNSRKGKSVGSHCCDVDKIQIIMPQNSNTNDNICSGKTAKIIIPLPAEKLSTIPMSDLLIFSSSSSSSNISSMLKDLQKLVDKYEL